MRKIRALTIGELNQVLGGELSGDSSSPIRGIARLEDANAGDLAFVGSPKMLSLADAHPEATLIVYPDFPDRVSPLIRVANPMAAFFKALSLLYPQRELETPSIHPSVILGKGTSLGENVYLGPNVVIGRFCQLGNNIRIEANTVIADDVTVGDDTVIACNGSIRNDTVIGKRVVVHPGVVLGADGFGFQNIDGVNQKIPQLGQVQLEDDVEIGANTAIDRATIGATIIEKGVKIDNLVQIGHNCVIGSQTVIAGQTGIAGSSLIGKGVIIGGQVGIADHVVVGDQAILAAQSGVMGKVPPKSVLWGVPARSHSRVLREIAVIRQLPELAKKIRKIENKLSEFFSESEE
ncbi:UDP-3-O-(3-hydroxymyristoyl)glucosamine N-acyltransferase [bacterium]|nr:UDP-3-O-(3-hydroxymyristoyl)glucosamine N-acyltransferase [bacterium]